MMLIPVMRETFGHARGFDNFHALNECALHVGCSTTAFATPAHDCIAEARSPRSSIPQSILQSALAAVIALFYSKNIVSVVIRMALGLHFGCLITDAWFTSGRICGKREVRTLFRSLNDKPEQEITNPCRRWPSRYGLHTEASGSCAAKPSDRLPVAYNGGTESSEVFYIGSLSERRWPPYKPRPAQIGSGTLLEQFREEESHGR